MILCRWLEKHSPPRGRKINYVAYLIPEGSPNTAVICGSLGCENPTVIWVPNNEINKYNQGKRNFAGNNNFTKVKASNTPAIPRN